MLTFVLQFGLKCVSFFCFLLILLSLMLLFCLQFINSSFWQIVNCIFQISNPFFCVGSAIIALKFIPHPYLLHITVILLEFDLGKCWNFIVWCNVNISAEVLHYRFKILTRIIGIIFRKFWIVAQIVSNTFGTKSQNLLRILVFDFRGRFLFML